MPDSLWSSEKFHKIFRFRESQPQMEVARVLCLDAWRGGNLNAPRCFDKGQANARHCLKKKRLVGYNPKEVSLLRGSKLDVIQPDPSRDKIV